MTIFAASTPNSFCGHEMAVAIFVFGCLLSTQDKRLSIRSELLHSCCNLSLATWRKDSLSTFTYTFSFMPNSKKNQSVAKHSTNTATSAHETCTKFESLIREQYPQLRSLRYFRRRWGGKPEYVFRAQIKRRRLYSWGKTPEYAIARFALEILRKLYREQYLPTEEYEARREELQRRVIMTYAIYELTHNPHA
jgi:hypothetical protein